jgi:hypothetical protein
MERWIEDSIRRLHQHTKYCEEVKRMSEDLPKQDLLVKLLKMTTSNNDGEALTAMRKANALLLTAGWDWDKLIAGKIKVVEDPFKSVMDPFAYRDSGPRPRPAPPPQPKQAPPQQQARYGSGGAYSAQQPGAAPPRSQQAPKPQGNPIGSTKENIYAGWCFCCGDAVLGKQGFIFDPANRNKSAKSKWQIVCKVCNVKDFPNIGPTAYPRQRPLGNATPSLNDI